MIEKEKLDHWVKYKGEILSCPSCRQRVWIVKQKVIADSKTGEPFLVLICAVCHAGKIVYEVPAGGDLPEKYSLAD